MTEPGEATVSGTDASARPWVRGYRLLMAAAVLAAIGYDFWRVSVQFHQTAGNYFSYFTIQGNLLAAAVLAWGAIRPRGTDALRAVLRGAAVLYLLVTGIVYAVLLSGLGCSVVPWVDAILHRVAPAVVALDWFVDRPGPVLALRRATLWLVYPLVYLGYSLLRGLATGWYPYPFLNPGRVSGYAAVAAWCGALALGIVALAGLVLLVGRNARRVEL